MGLKIKLTIGLLAFFCSSAFGQWRSLNEPAGGYIREITSDGDAIFATTGGGVLVSLDEGEHWEFRNSGLSSHDTKSIVSFEDYVLVTTDEGVFRSKNQGESWEVAGGALEGVYVKSIVVHNNVLFAGTYLKGIFRSKNFGESWDELNIGYSAEYVYYLNSDGSQVYAGTYLDGLLKSTDMGETWGRANNGLTENSVMSVFSFDDKTILGTLSKGMFISSDKGENWEPVSSNLPNVKGFSFLNGVLYAATSGNGAFKSFDHGGNWEHIQLDFDDKNLWAIYAFDNVLILGTKAGHIYRKEEGDDWELVFDGEIRSNVGLLAKSNGRLMVGTRGSGFYSRTANAENWERHSDIWTVENRGVISVGNTVLVGTDMLGVFRSTNGGKSYQASNSGLKSKWIQAFTYSDGKFFAGSGDKGVFISEDSGATWKAVNKGLKDGNIMTLANDGENVYLGSLGDGVYRLSDVDGRWIKASDGLPNDVITQLEFLNGVLFAGTKRNGLFVSSDRGHNWSPQGRMPSMDSHISSLFVKGSTLFVGTAQGRVFYTKDKGDSWYRMDVNSEGSSAVFSLCEFEEDMYAGLDGDGLWKASFEELDLSLDISLSSHTVKRNESLEFIVGILGVDGGPEEEKYVYSIAGKDAAYLKNNEGQLLLAKSLEGIDSDILEVIISAENSRGLVYSEPMAIEIEDIVTGIDVLAEAPQLKVFPVPAKDFLRVKLSTEFKGEVKITLQSLNGRQKVLKDVNAFANRSIEVIELDVRSMPSGLYLLKVQSQNTEGSIKILIE